ncbi:hypothetical protein GF323_06620 [Candidatus Woesearchaeota archaeon]|nr:hypothetical protein [Candidatus Woesearchaeota archaeon]
MEAEKEEKSKEQEQEQPSRRKDDIVIYTIAALVIIFGIVFLVPRFFENGNETLDQLHEKNLRGKLSAEKGYVYKDVYSFVYYAGLWYTQLSTPTGETLFNIPFHYGPRDVEDLEIIGNVNYTNLDDYDNFFVTFNPLDEDLNYIGVAIGEFDNIIIRVFGKGIVAACSQNETSACTARPIVECNSTDAPVFYFASEPETNVLYLDNCVIISGKREDLFKATDRVLFDLLGIM